MIAIVLLIRTVDLQSCEYKSDDEIIFQGSIESVRIVKQTVFPCIEDRRKWRIKIDARIKRKWYPPSGEYVFGPDMSETESCSKAENRAKLSIMREVIPETLKSKRELNCSKKDLTKSKSSCTIAYMDVLIRGQGKQKLKMEMCK